MRVLEEWLLTTARAAIHLPTNTAVVADLHLGYERVRRRSGEALPARTIAQELAPLGDLLRREKVRGLAIAGDLFEDGRYQRDEMVEEFLAWVGEVGVELVGVVPGNHDRGLGATSLPLCPEGIALGGWRIVHGDGPPGDGAIVQGHEHPYLRFGPGVEGPCYLVRSGHVVLPAYSKDAAGGNVLGKARWLRYGCCAIAGERVLDFGEIAQLAIRKTVNKTGIKPHK